MLVYNFDCERQKHFCVTSDKGKCVYKPRGNTAHPQAAPPKKKKDDVILEDLLKVFTKTSTLIFHFLKT
jgi:hypothetical protein